MKRPWLIPAVAGSVLGLGTLLVIGVRNAKLRQLQLHPGADPWNFSPPLDNPIVTQGWGEPRAYRCPRDEVTGKCLYIPIHEGLDFRAAKGTRLKALADGTVVDVDSSANSNAGRNITIDYGHGLVVSYLHLSVIKVHVGQIVRRGQYVADSGDSGASGDDSFADHLHATGRANGDALALYEKLFGKPKTGWGGKTKWGWAVPLEPLVPARYSAGVVAAALSRRVAMPRQLAA